MSEAFKLQKCCFQKQNLEQEILVSAKSNFSILQTFKRRYVFKQMAVLSFTPKYSVVCGGARHAAQGMHLNKVECVLVTN